MDDVVEKIQWGGNSCGNAKVLLALSYWVIHNSMISCNLCSNSIWSILALVLSVWWIYACSTQASIQMKPKKYWVSLGSDRGCCRFFWWSNEWFPALKCTVSLIRLLQFLSLQSKLQLMMTCWMPLQSRFWLPSS